MSAADRVSFLIGLVMLVAGLWMLGGAPVTLLVVGALVAVLAAVPRRRPRSEDPTVTL